MSEECLFSNIAGKVCSDCPLGVVVRGGAVNECEFDLEYDCALNVLAEKSSEISKAIYALIEALGMFSENMQRQHLGYSMAYDDGAFYKLLPKE